MLKCLEERHAQSIVDSDLVLPAMHLLCMCSMLVPSEFSHLRKWHAKILHFCTFRGVQRARKSCRNFSGSALSFDNSSFLILVRVIAQEALKTLKWPSGCAHLLVHIRCVPIVQATKHRVTITCYCVDSTVSVPMRWERHRIVICSSRKCHYPLYKFNVPDVCYHSKALEGGEP